ncbi:Ubiquinone/menaquinone biosynthesis C-methylase UbiE [Parafrankia irregularis]|uniref:Ubiquinone/menaquinone biosynthesis C-methylase UbiE n=1 Tax=Parafrankia irregularis TaxID=795642 RepID=A0A0S4QWU5_9ACTN|nr:MULTISPECIES: class I SAM-dependent methyltransferase [Parafrankia]MBE3205815.1 class I SAM-dependent methyltransferase [Parafrankia sp. CH37]CUU59689.1 Ubiquinone/menaquinone biosynthesis C-methylase UbiE [Parafrankia irregularis]
MNGPDSALPGVRGQTGRGGPTGPDTWASDDTDLFLRYGDAFVPARGQQLALLVAAVSATGESPHVLDLCCGAGTLTRLVLEHVQDASVVGLDGSTRMLAAAETACAAYRDRVAFTAAALESAHWRTPSAYDAVVTSLAVHHLDDAGKRALYEDVHRMLRPGGWFAMADLVLPTTEWAQRVAAEQWDETVASASHRQFGSREASEAFAEHGWNHFTDPEPDPVDRPSPIASHLAWLTRAGFADIDVPFAFAGHAVIVAHRRRDER